MSGSDLRLERPLDLQADAPAERRGLRRDDVRLLVSDRRSDRDASFADLPDFLRAGDLLVVNRSATLPASLPAVGPGGPFRLNLSSSFGSGRWLGEPRPSYARPGPMPLEPGTWADVGASRVRWIRPHPAEPRLWLLDSPDDLGAEMARSGEPIRYGYTSRSFPLTEYQTIFGDVPGSSEMPSAGRPFTDRTLADLARRGVELVRVTLHCGVSSLELSDGPLEGQALLPEPFEVSADAAGAINRARAEGRRIIAVGTTVVRALESASRGGELHAASGWTARFVRPGRPPSTVDGLLTGFHDASTSHLALLFGLAGPETIRRAYGHAVTARYLWHEFGDVHLILPGRAG